MSDQSTACRTQGTISSGGNNFFDLAEGHHNVCNKRSRDAAATIKLNTIAQSCTRLYTLLPLTCRMGAGRHSNFTQSFPCQTCCVSSERRCQCPLLPRAGTLVCSWNIECTAQSGTLAGAQPEFPQNWTMLLVLINSVTKAMIANSHYSTLHAATIARGGRESLHNSM